MKTIMVRGKLEKVAHYCRLGISLVCGNVHQPWQTFNVPFSQSRKIKRLVHSFFKERKIEWTKSYNVLEWQISLTLEEMLVSDDDKVRAFAKKVVEQKC